MKPSFSLILFTVCSGAGYGLFTLTVAHAWFGSVPLSLWERSIALVLALLLIIVGLFSSVFHLANKKNGWKAFSRFLTSWLSREAVFSVLFFVPAVLYFAGQFMQGAQGTVWLSTAGIAAVLLSLATVFSTGMIYASLKTIRQWHNPLVPINYLLLALASGGVLLSTIRALVSNAGENLLGLTLALLATALLVKLIYYFWIGIPAGANINTALAMNRARIRLLDVGHSHGTFLTDEFGKRISRGVSNLLRGWVLIAAYVVPFVLLLNQHVKDAAAQMLLALLFMFAGLLVERWLFLAEGQHVVNLYHGRQRT